MAIPFGTRLNQLFGEKQFLTYNRIEVFGAALRHNVSFMHATTRMQVIPVLKGNAYGHGIAQVARALRGTDLPIAALAVDGYHEALQVRKVSRLPVIIMGKIKAANFAVMKYDNFEFVVSDQATVQALAATRRSISLHLELNTGMNRYGVTKDAALALATQIKQAPQLQLKGIMSHLADSDGSDQSTLDEAVDRFDAWVADIEAITGAVPIKHIAQTAGSVRAKSKVATAMRLGIGLYGINPFTIDHPSHQQLAGLKPAMRYISTIAAVHDLQVGEGVGYNYSFRATKPMRIGVLPLGYYEGLPHAFSNRGVLRGSGHYVPIVGKVCMNHCMIDITHTPLKLGDEITVISDNPGEQNSIQHLSDRSGLFPYATLVQLSAANRRVLID